MPQNYEDLLDLDVTPVEFLDDTGDKEVRTRIRTYLGSLKYTADEMEHPIRELSGGQKAKVLLLKMSLSDANVLVLDEPTRNFSPLSGPVIRKMIASFPGAVISISHDRKYIEKINNNGGKATNDYYITTSVTMYDELDAMKSVFQKKLKKLVNYRDKGFRTIGLIMLMTDPPIPQTADEWGTIIHSINLEDRIEMKYNKIINLKNGKEALLRNGEFADGEAVFVNFNETHAETDYLLSYPDENSFDAQQEAEFLKEKTESPNEIEIVAVVDGVVAGTAHTL